MQHARSSAILCALLAFKMAAMIFVILHAGIGLGPDEAQYWTWSQKPDWGYYSKPPGIAWEIWLGTQLFGNTELGVRIMAVIIGLIIPALVYLMAKGCRLLPSNCLWAAICMALAPLGILASFLAITDGGMVLFWTATCAYIVTKLERAQTPNYLIIGLLIGCGALFKWPIFCLWLLLLVHFRFYPQLASRKIILGIALSMAALLPSIYWNATHDWATFKHVLSTMQGGHGQAHAHSGGWFAGNFWDFLGAQAALVSPILFSLLLPAFYTLMRQRSQAPVGVLFCGSLSCAILGFASLSALFMKMQGNWAIFAYPTAFVVLAWYAGETVRAKKWLKIGLGLSIAACAFAFSIPALQSHSIGDKWPISFRFNPFRHNVGWTQLERELRRVGYHPQQDFLFGDKYQMASLLSFYSEGQKQAYFLNLHGVRKNQFSYWPGISHELSSGRGFFVAVENLPLKKMDLTSLAERYAQELKVYFKEVQLIEIQPIFWSYGHPAKSALIFECREYNGNSPAETLLY